MTEVIENYQHEDLIWNGTDRKMQLDVYLPNERLAFEYQGQQHYYNVHALGTLWLQREKDKEKREACEQHGITLIEIPYWWDFKEPSLRATIHLYKPKLINRGDGWVIPSKPPREIPKGNNLKRF
jgi:hypothetical protein